MLHVSVTNSLHINSYISLFINLDALDILRFSLFSRLFRQDKILMLLIYVRMMVSECRVMIMVLTMKRDEMVLMMVIMEPDNRRVMTVLMVTVMGCCNDAGQ